MGVLLKRNGHFNGVRDRLPGLLGGVNMYPNAYNPQTGDLYLAATNSGMKYGFEEIKVISNVRHFGDLSVPVVDPWSA